MSRTIMCFILSTNKYKCCVSRPLLSDRNFENRVTGNAFKKKKIHFPTMQLKCPHRIDLIAFDGVRD